MQAATTRRSITAGDLELRTSADGVTVEGYAATFEQPYDMGWYNETIKRGAFKKTLSENPDVTLLVNHDGLPLARSRSNTLQLSEDSTGLHVRSTLDASDPDVQRIVPKMQRGDLDSMSFGFHPVRQAWSEDYSQRSISEVSLAGGDVSIVTDPANPNTSVSLRMKALATAEPEKLRAIYAEIMEDRSGKTLSAATATQLRSVLESLGTIDDSVEDAVDVLEGMLSEPLEEEARGFGRSPQDLRILIALAKR